MSLISKSLCVQLECKIKSNHTGKRMSGQEITLPISEVKSLSFGSIRQTEAPVGIFDMEKLMPGTGIDGFLSLGFFKDTAFTIDYKNKLLTIESSSSLVKVKASGVAVRIQIDHRGVSTSIHMPLILPNGKQISAEVDTGSQALILNEKFMAALGIIGNEKSVRREEGKDETGHVFNRYFTALRGPVYLLDHPGMKVESINAIFQKIIYDGLVGHFFLREFTVTYDLKKSEMIFRKP